MHARLRVVIAVLSERARRRRDSDRPLDGDARLEAAVRRERHGRDVLGLERVLGGRIGRELEQLARRVAAGSEVQLGRERLDDTLRRRRRVRASVRRTATGAAVHVQRA